MPRDKYHPHMVDFPLNRRMSETGHTAASVRAFLLPYEVDVGTIARWRKRNRVPYNLERMITLGLSQVEPPQGKWIDMDLRKERTLRRISRRILSQYIGANQSTLIDWEDRMAVPRDKHADLKKFFEKVLPARPKRS